MKSLIRVFLVCVLPLLNTSICAQCSAETYKERAVLALENYKYIKAFRIDGRGGTRKIIKYTIVTSARTAYKLMISSKEGGAKGIIATITDNKGDTLLHSFQKNGEYKNKIYFSSENTGIHFITFTFGPASKSFCGTAALGFYKGDSPQSSRLYADYNSDPHKPHDTEGYECIDDITVHKLSAPNRVTYPFALLKGERYRLVFLGIGDFHYNRPKISLHTQIESELECKHEIFESLQVIDFECKHSGEYYISFIFPDGSVKDKGILYLMQQASE